MSAGGLRVSLCSFGRIVLIGKTPDLYSGFLGSSPSVTSIFPVILPSDRGAFRHFLQVGKTEDSARWHTSVEPGSLAAGINLFLQFIGASA